MQIQNKIQAKLTRLREILTGSQFKLPLFVRFRTENRSFIVPVSRVEISGNAVKVYNGNPDILASYLYVDKILSVDALFDSLHNPFFLSDLDDTGEVILEETSNSQER
jgi:hypothetical protein